MKQAMALLRDGVIGDVLQQLALDYPLPKAILEYRSISKLKSTYTDKLPRMADARSGRPSGRPEAQTGRGGLSGPPSASAVRLENVASLVGRRWNSPPRKP